MNRNYVVRRAGQAAVTVWAVVTITFGMIRLLPGDPQAFLMAMSAGRGANVDPDLLLEETSYDPDATLIEQYVGYVGNLAGGDLGVSTHFQEPVAGILAESLPWTLFIVALALPLTFGIGIVLGAIMAYREGSRFDVVLSSLSTFLNSVPYYLAAVVMVYFLGYQSGLFPNRRRYPAHVDPGLSLDFVMGAFYHAALPVLSIVITAFGFRALAMRGNSIQVLGEDYVRVADLRGLPDRRIALQYVGRNAVLPIYTEFMIGIGVVLGSTVILERIFQYEGLGFFFYRAIGARDYPLMMGAFLVISITVVLGLLVADLTYGLIDPRASTKDVGVDVPSIRERLGFLALWFRRLPERFRGWSHRRFRGNRRASAAPTATAGDSPFEVTADVDVSRRERYRRFLDEYVLAPGRIIWSDTRARIGAAIILLYLLIGTVGVKLVPEPTSDGPQYVGAFRTLEYPLGTNVLGTDLFREVVHATPPMLEMIAAGAVASTVVATAAGLVSGYSGGWVDRGIMLCADIILAIPGLPLVMVLAVIIEPTQPWAVGLMLTVNLWGGTARQIRSQVLAIRGESYVEASDIMSLGKPTILVKDILPNIMPFVFVRGVNMARQVIVLSVALYFLGVLTFSGTNWGIMLRSAYENGGLYSPAAVHWLMIPTVTIVAFIYGLILFAQGTDRVFNPQVRARHAETLDEEEFEGESEPKTTIATGGD